MNPANFLTGLRVALAVASAASLTIGSQSGMALAIALFCLALLTDLFDGRIARRKGNASPLGGRFDGLADKFLSLIMLLALASNSVIPLWLAGLLIARNFLTSEMRSIAVEHGRTLPVTSFVGKLRVFLEYIGIVAGLLSLLAGSTVGAKAFIFPAQAVAQLLLVVALAIGTWGVLVHLRALQGISKSKASSAHNL